jgi:hypothetical protein
MKLRLPAVLAVVVLAACAATPEQPTAEGLVRSPSSQLDQVYVRPNADLPRYNKVVLGPVPVALRSDWIEQRHAYNGFQPMYPPVIDAEGVKKEMADLMQADVAEAFRAAGYETVALAGPGVLRASAKVDDLFINAPERLFVARQATRDAGQAKLSLEVRDSVSGLVLARVEHFAIAREALRANPADDVSNRMWLDVAFRRFAAHSVGAFGNARRTAVTLAQ